MSLTSLFSDLAARMQSAEFHELARHPDHPTAFTRRRKLPLPSLVTLMMSGMRKSIQAELPANDRINRTYVNTALKPLLPVLLLGKTVSRKIRTLLGDLLRLVARRTYRHRENRSKPRRAGQKPHKPMTQKQC